MRELVAGKGPYIRRRSVDNVISELKGLANQGATTMWERWNSYSHKDGFGNAGMNSFNHYAYGAIGQWMYERIAGLGGIQQMADRADAANPRCDARHFSVG